MWATTRKKFSSHLLLEMQKKLLVLDLGHGDDENKIEKCIYDNQLQVFLKLSSKFLQIEPLELKTSEDMRRFIKEFTSYSESTQNIPVNLTCYPPSLTYHPYIRSYVLFILENISFEKKECQNLIRSVKSVPAFMKSLSWKNEMAIYLALTRFIAIHASGNAASVEQPDTVTRLASSRIGRDTDGCAKIGRI